MSTHRVKRALLELDAPDESTALRLRPLIERAFFDQMLPVIEEVFDSHVPDGTTLTLDRLEIDLGTMYRDGIDLDALRRAVRARLVDLRSNEEAVLAETSDETLTRTLTLFLETGRWVWNAPVSTLAELEGAIIETSPSRNLISGIVPLLDRPAVRHRLVRQFSASFVDWIVEQIRPGMAAEIRRAVEEAMPSATERERLELQLDLMRTLPPGEQLHVALAHAARRSVIAREELPSMPSAELLHAEEEAVPGADDSMYVMFAGIVLLHPFISRLFRGLRLVDENDRFNSWHERERAIFVLHYLATGTASCEEQTATLLKLLCGVPWAHPIEREVALTSHEQTEANTMLDAAISHWDRLRHSSVDALRETFLQRDGRLVRDGTGWRLTVEERGVDVILATLPWSLMAVRFPWMASTLWVDWA